MRVRLTKFTDSVIQYLCVCLISDYRGLALCLRLNDHYVSLCLGFEHIDLPPYECRVHDLFGCGSLLNHDLCVDYRALIYLGEINLQEHETCTVRMGCSQLLPELGFKGGSNESAICPVLGRSVVASLLEDKVGRNASEEGFVVETG